MKEIFENLLAHYKMHLEAVQALDDVAMIKAYMRKAYIGAGMCFAAERVLRVDIYESPWIKKALNRSGKRMFIAEMPLTLDERGDIIAAIQARITIMEELLSEAAKEAPHA